MEVVEELREAKERLDQEKLVEQQLRAHLEKEAANSTAIEQWLFDKVITAIK